MNDKLPTQDIMLRHLIEDARAITPAEFAAAVRWPSARIEAILHRRSKMTEEEITTFAAFFFVHPDVFRL